LLLQVPVGGEDVPCLEVAGLNALLDEPLELVIERDGVLVVNDSIHG
jgi:hypothetical protein